MIIGPTRAADGGDDGDGDDDDDDDADDEDDNDADDVEAAAENPGDSSVSASPSSPSVLFSARSLGARSAASELGMAAVCDVIATSTKRCVTG